jgi:hypothetical protein
MKGGQQALSLFLGDDSNYVKLPWEGGVEIATQSDSQYSWTFGTDGSLTLPDSAPILFGGNNCQIQAGQGFRISSDGGILVQVTDKQWVFGPDGTLDFPDATVQTTAWTGVFSYNDLADKPNLAGTYTWSIAADDSTQLEIGTSNLVKIQGAGGITTALDADGNVTITGEPGIVTSATAPTDALYTLWYNSTDGRTYVKYNDRWVDANPPVVPQVSTYLDGLVVEGTTITTVSYADTDIKIHDLTFKDTGVIQLPEGGDIVDSEGNSVLDSVTSYNDLTDKPTIPSLTGYATEAFVTNALSNSGIIVSATAPTGQPEGKLWYNSASLELYVRYNNVWVAASSSGGSGTTDYNELTNKPTNVSQFANDAGYVTMDQVYAAILELGSTN